MPVAAYDDRGRPLLFGLGETPAGLRWAKAGGTTNNQRLSRQQTALLGRLLAQDRTISYELVGNVTERNTTLDGATWRGCYGYDQRQRLIEAFTTSGDCAKGGTAPRPSSGYAYLRRLIEDG